jgi:hypothetical protein
MLDAFEEQRPRLRKLLLGGVRANRHASGQTALRITPKPG